LAGETIIRFSLDSPAFIVDGIPHFGTTAPITENDTEMLPLQTLADILHADFEWDAIAETVLLTIDGTEHSFRTDQPLPNNAGYPTVHGGHMFVPFTFAAQLLNAELHRYNHMIYLFM
jgi:hypothetical protein